MLLVRYLWLLWFGFGLIVAFYGCLVGWCLGAGTCFRFCGVASVAA